MERTYGKDLVGMRDPETGKFDPARFGWDNRATGGALLGAQLSVEIAPGTTIDATTASAYLLGWVKGMQYDGLSSGEKTGVLAREAELSNCFASSYAFVQTLDTAAMSWNSLGTEPGSYRWLDVLMVDPMNIVADLAVNFE